MVAGKNSTGALVVWTSAGDGLGEEYLGGGEARTSAEGMTLLAGMASVGTVLVACDLGLGEESSKEETLSDLRAKKRRSNGRGGKK